MPFMCNVAENDEALVIILRAAVCELRLKCLELQMLQLLFIHFVKSPKIVANYCNRKGTVRSCKYIYMKHSHSKACKVT